MKMPSVISTFMAAILLSVCSLDMTFAQNKKKTWNNPQAQKRYRRYLKETVEAHRNEGKAWENYDRELKRAQDDVRRVRNDSIKGALKGGAPGAAAGAAEGCYKGAPPKR